MADSNTPAVSGIAAPPGGFSSPEDAADRYSAMIESNEVLDTRKPDEETEAQAETESTEESGTSETPEDDETRPPAEDDAEEKEAQATQETVEFDPEAEIAVKGLGKVKLQHLIDGNLRTADYTRKTQEVARDREIVRSRAAQIQQLETQLAERQTFIETVLGQMVPQMPKFDPEDPVGYLEKKAAYDTQIGTLGALQRQFGQYREQAQQRATAEQEQARFAHEHHEFESFLNDFPQYRDESKFIELRNEALEYGSNFWNLKREEMESIQDHRWGRVLHDAILYRRHQKAVKAATAKAGASAKASPSPKGPQSGVQQPARRSGPELSANVKALKDRARKSGGGLDEMTDLYFALQKRR